MRPPKSSRLSQRIDPGLKAQIADEAERRHLDETAIVTIALTEYFERQRAQPAAPTPDRLTKQRRRKPKTPTERS